MNQGAETLEAFLMSPQQRRLWKVSRGEATYSSSCVLVAEGPLSPRQVEGALRQACARHEVLRTGLRRPPGLGVPAQVIVEDCAPGLAVHDLRGLPGDVQELRLEQCIADELAAEFDVERPPLLRAALACLEDERHALVLVLSSLVADSWSLDNLVAELCRSIGGEPAEDGEPMQYADFSEWQNGFESPEGEEGRDYWRAKGLQLPLTPVLPLGPATDRFLPGEVSWSLDEAGAVRLEALAAVRGAGLADLLLAGWAAVLWHQSAEPGLVIGYLAHGRRYEPLRGALGLIARFLPLACMLSAETGFWDLVALVRDTVAEDLVWQELFTWDAIAETSEPPAFPVAFALEESQPSLEAGVLRFAVQSRQSCVDRFGVELRGTRWRGEGLQLAIRYDLGRFAPASAGALAARLKALLDRVAAGTDEAVDALRGLGGAAAHSAAIEVNDTERLLRASTLQQRFAEQVASHPGAVALIAGDTQITYADLGRRVGAVARALTRRGLRPGELVGLCTEHSVDAVAGLLGILAADGAFFYLDPELPEARLALLAGNAAPRLVLARRSALSRLERMGLGCGLLPLDSDGPVSEEPLEAAAGDPDRLAYVVYTSGSTGAPKGVLAPQRGVLNYLDFIVGTYGLLPSDIVLQLASLSFDASVRDLIGPLLRGATVVLLTPEQARDPREMVLAIQRHGVNRLLSVVPTLLRALVAAAEREEGPFDLQSILTSGERLFGEDCRRVRSAFGAAVQIVNQYGPTECTMTSSWRAVPPETSWDAVPLGWPAWNVRFHLLDERLDPVPEGWPGELYIAGAGLAWGYVGQPDLTAARFLPEVRAASPGSRMYRTGDRVRRLPDGDLEFLGRLDDQLKIRGVRVEPGEIEAVLGRHPDVRQAVVVGRGERLAAYVVPRQEGGIRPVDVMAYLRENLPEPLVPADLVVLPRLPLTRTGKVDRRALPEPETMWAEPAAAPLNPLEEIVAQIWAQLLGRKRIGPDESFFSLGGHSLLATQAMARLRDALGVQIPLQAAFEAPTAAAMAKRVQQALAGGIQLPSLQSVPRSGFLPLSFPQERHWFLHVREPESPLFNNAGGLRFRGRLDVRALAGSLRELVRRHEVLRAGFPAVNGEPVQAIVPVVLIGLPVVDLDGLPEGARDREASRLVSAHALRPFDIARPPLLRMVLLRLREDEHVAAVAMHHIISDLWSVGVFVRELAALYEAAATGRPSPLPDLELQYADFAAWQREWLQGDVLDRLLAYWKGQLPPGGRAPQLFSDRAAEEDHPPGRRYPLTVPASLAAGLRDLARTEGATVFMTLLAGFQLLLFHLTGVDDVVVGAPIANRKLTETEGMIGCFINALALRTGLGDNPSFRQLLGRVRKTVLGAYTHQDLPFEKLVEELNPNRALSRWPLFQVTFNFQNEPIGVPPLPGLTVETFDIEGGMPVKYDLGLYLTDSGGDLSGALGYSPALFEASTVAGICESFVELLALCGEQPDATAGEILAALAEAERHRRATTQELHRESRRRSLGQARRKAVQA
ncbi:MAG TPA: amino acid adenylation domain-containing protein [Thermoanaerobaculia bacterium]|nr:amino acid adenylation domain-containing protein [Thermoanaerobaculia bacterium]